MDGNGEVVGLANGRHGREHVREQTASPVPTFPSERWSPVFFEAISAAYRLHPSFRLYIPLSHFVDGCASATVESRYLALHVGLEAFAHWILGGDKRDNPPLVDKQRWRAWLKSSSDGIREAAAPGQGQRLYDRIVSIPARASSSRVVEEAFEKYGLILTDEMREELQDEGRGMIVHTASMFKEAPDDVGLFRRKIALVRTMLVALIARVVGYKGAISGWEQPGSGIDEPSKDWWPVEEAARAAAFHTYLADVPASANAES